jgi:hypothetical protein
LLAVVALGASLVIAGAGTSRGIALAHDAAGVCFGLVDPGGAARYKGIIGRTVCSNLSQLAARLVGSSEPSTTAAAPVDVSAPAYPLKVSANGRYLVDQKNVPFLMVGDSPQALIGNVSEADADLFLANRHQYGVNTIWVNLLCNAYIRCNEDATTYDGIPPFTTQGDLGTPNAAYFARLDRHINLAGDYGMTVVLDPIETGGFTEMLRTNGIDAAYNYGKYVGERYRSFPNIIWMSGNDFQTWSDPDDDALVRAVAQGIHDADPEHIQTVELNYRVSASMDDPTWAPLVQLDAAYTYFPTYAEILEEYNREPHLPVFMVEANYEFENDYTGPEALRRQEYWTMLSGATGQLYGSRYMWPFGDGWKDHLNTLGMVQLQHMASLFAPRRWYDLVPDQDHTLVTAGYGTYVDSGSVNDSDYVTAARTADGRLAIAYIPSGKPITVQLGAMSQPVVAQWYDPGSGTFVPIGSSAIENVGEQVFQAPGGNSDGDPDWVLLLEAR